MQLRPGAPDSMGMHSCAKEYAFTVAIEGVIAMNAVHSAAMRSSFPAVLSSIRIDGMQRRW